MNNINPQPLKSHQLSPESLSTCIESTSARIIREGNKPYVTVERQLELLQQLSQFDFGRFLLQNKGVNGYWTHYVLTHPWYGRKTGKNNRGESFTNLEHFLLDEAPTILATQQRFQFFLVENQKSVASNSSLACIPSGMMGELLYLNFDNTDNIQLIGVDYDAIALQEAKNLAAERNLTDLIQVEQRDAWQLNYNNAFDLISSNGLNIYEPNDDKVVMLYNQFYRALKKGGKLVTSFLTPPIGLHDRTEWDTHSINPDHLLLQKIIFVDIVQATWQCFRSSATTKTQLESVGFKDIGFIYDQAKMFPTVVAFKK